MAVVAVVAVVAVAAVVKNDFFRTGGNIGKKVKPGNTKGGSITVPLTSCLTGLD